MNDVFVQTSKEEYAKGRCEVCGQYTFEGNTRGTLDVCEICFWTDDEYHKNKHEACGGPNHRLSVSMAKKNFRKYGICSPKLLR